MLSADAKWMLQEYERGNLSNPELAEWLVQVEYDTSLQSGERDALAGLHLVVMEEAEEARPKEEVLDAVAGILASESPNERVFTVRTSSSTKKGDQKWVTGSATPARHAGTAV